MTTGRGLRFCMVTTFYPPFNFGGDGIFVERLSTELARRGHHVEVIHCEDAYRVLARDDAPPAPRDQPGVVVHRLKSPFGWLSPLATQQSGHPLLKARRIRAILGQGFDVINFHNVSLVGGPGILKYGQGIKLYTLHEYWLVCPTHILFRFNRAPCVKPHCVPCTLSYRRPPQLWRYTPLLRSAVRRVIGEIRDPLGMPVIQEFVPGRERQNFYLVADRASEVAAVLCPKVVRYASRLYNDNFGSVESANAHPLLSRVKQLVRELEWSGALTLQTKVDVRDGVPKLLEMNPRVGLHLWYRTALGYNEPLTCLQIARGQDVPAHEFPEGTLLLTPLEDSLRIGVDFLDRLIYRLRGGPPIDPHNPPRPFGERARAYARDYFGKKPRAFSPYWTHLLDDPLPCLLWWYAYAGFCARSLRTLGR
jgi:hypothetical protein